MRTFSFIAGIVWGGRAKTAPETRTLVVVPWRTAEFARLLPVKIKRARVAPERLVLGFAELVEAARSAPEEPSPRLVCVHVQEIHKLALEWDVDVSVVCDSDAIDTGGGSLYETTYTAWIRGWCEEPGPDRTFFVVPGDSRVFPLALAPEGLAPRAGECPVCYEPKLELLASRCGHALCRRCVGALATPRCPECRDEPCVWYGGPPQVASVVRWVLEEEHPAGGPVVAVVDDPRSAPFGAVRNSRLTTRSTLTAAARLEFPTTPVAVVAHHDEKTLEYMCRYIRHTLLPEKVYACLVGR